MFVGKLLILLATLTYVMSSMKLEPFFRSHNKQKYQKHKAEALPAHYDPTLAEPELHNIFELHPVDPEQRRRSRRQLRAAEMTPLFPGYGTHYVYAYIGTPPQRQSLIVDTGSHLTAFPCTGCKQCGEHTDSYWDITKSSSAMVPKCPNFKDGKCQVSQSYTEGSSWHGYKVVDNLWVGGEKSHLVPQASDYAVNFTFACQTEETGLFRTQLADGIMGMSASPDTLINVLAEAKVTDNKVFALCYRTGGGIFTLGGVAQQIHAKRAVAYAAMDIRQGWYGVTLANIRFIDPKTGAVTELPASTKPLFATSATSGGKHRRLNNNNKNQSKGDNSNNTNENKQNSNNNNDTNNNKNKNNNNNSNNEKNSNSGNSNDNSKNSVKDTNNKDTKDTSKDNSNNSNSNKDNNNNKNKNPKPQQQPPSNSLPVNVGIINRDKGVIVDSGTTDTYLAQAIAEGFKTAFKTASKGIAYSTGNIPLSEAQMAQMPDIAFDLYPVNWNGNGNVSAADLVTIRMPVTSYLDSVGEGKYTFRIYLTEKSGGVLGANFMNDLNVIFDMDKKRLGFAKSTCNFEEFNAPITSAPTFAPSKPPSQQQKPGDNTENNGGCGVSTPNVFVPYTQCSARCDRPDENAYVSVGTQDFVSSCQNSVIITKDCSENCTHTLPVRGDPHCPDTPWTECSHACITTRKTVPITEPLYRKYVSKGTVSNVCNYQTQTSACYTAQCPRQDGDYLLYIDLHLHMDASRWSYVYAESFFVAIASLFHLSSPHNVELLNHYNADTSLITNSSPQAALRLHFQIRLKKRDFKTELQLHETAENMITKFRSGDFPRVFVETLDAISQVQDRNGQRRFGWLYPQDISVLSAVALPIGDVRNPYSKDVTGASSEDDDNNGRHVVFLNMTTWELFLLGAGIALFLVMGAVLYLHLKLREEYALLSKDKSTLARSGHALRKLWNKFADMAASTRGGNNNYSTGSNAVFDTSSSPSANKSGSVSAQQQQFELELSRRGLMMGDDLDDDEDLDDDGGALNDHRSTHG